MIHCCFMHSFSSTKLMNLIFLSFHFLLFARNLYIFPLSWYHLKLFFLNTQRCKCISLTEIFATIVHRTTTCWRRREHTICTSFRYCTPNLQQNMQVALLSTLSTCTWWILLWYFVCACVSICWIVKYHHHHHHDGHRNTCTHIYTQFLSEQRM